MIVSCVHFDKKIHLTRIIEAIIAAIIVVSGWFIISYLDRKNETAKERQKYRLEVLHDIINFRVDYYKNKRIANQDLYDKSFLGIQLYGNNDEIVIFRKFEKKANEHKIKEAEDALEELIIICRDRIREELNLPKSKDTK